VGEQVAIDAAGNATIVWHRIVTATTGLPHGEYWVSARVRVRRFDADGSLGPVLGIPNQGGFDSSPQLAVEPSGRGVIAWARGRLGRLRTLAGDFPGSPAVVGDARGVVTAAWGADLDGTRGIQASRFVPGR
jgi:hypothetical protein